MSKTKKKSTKKKSRKSRKKWSRVDGRKWDELRSVKIVIFMPSQEM